MVQSYSSGLLQHTEGNQQGKIVIIGQNWNVERQKQFEKGRFVHDS